MTNKPKTVVIAYEIADDQAWRDGGNPLKYEHHGLKAHTVSTIDVFAKCEAFEAELDRLADVVDMADAEEIEAVLRRDYQ